jgi:hypothetical protein
VTSQSPHSSKSKEDYDLIKRSISATRFESQRYTPADSDELIFARHEWNAALSEAFYIPLQVLEVVLRNRFNDAFIGNFQNPHWLLGDLGWLQQAELDYIAKAKKYISERNKPLTQDRMVEELSFGFWTSLLNRKHEDRIFRPMAVRIFPHVHASFRTRNAIAPRFEKIRKFRNTIFHYHRITQYPNLLSNLDEIVEALSWLNRDAPRLLIPSDARQRLASILSRAP